MSLFDGNASEMPEHRTVDDGAIEAALAGTSRDPAFDALSEFVSAVRSVVEVVPTPSTAMAAVLTAGLSTAKGDLSATAASNVNGPAPQEAGLPKWRKAFMKIQGFLAGLGVAGKVALGVGVAAAATTGAGAAGVLPFSHHGRGHAHHAIAVHTNTTTTVAVTPTTAVAAAGHAIVEHHDPVTTTTAEAPPTTVVVPVTTPTTAAPAPEPTTSTTVVVTPTTLAPTPTTLDSPTTTTMPATTTTTAPAGSTQSIQLSCGRTGPTEVVCNWTPAPGPVAKYALWRWTTSNGAGYGPVFESTDATRFADETVSPGVAYTYRIFTTLADGSSGPWSNKGYTS